MVTMISTIIPVNSFRSLSFRFTSWERVHAFIASIGRWRGDQTYLYIVSSTWVFILLPYSRSVTTLVWGRVFAVRIHKSPRKSLLSSRCEWLENAIQVTKHVRDGCGGQTFLIWSSAITDWPPEISKIELTDRLIVNSQLAIDNNTAPHITKWAISVAHKS